MAFFAEQVESIEEMAAPKMPEGMKRKRSATYAHTHDISIDGKHIATIAGHKPGWGNHGLAPHQKIYHVFKDEKDMLNRFHGDSGHPDHQYDETRTFHTGDGEYKKKTVKAPIPYHSMEDAVQAVHHNHKNTAEFGRGHDPKVRWQKAIDHAHEAQAHKEKKSQYDSAISHVRRLGHEEMASQLENHRDAHLAAHNGATADQLHRWTHDAHKFTGKSYKDGHYTPDHPEHHDLANAAIDAVHKATRGY
jgi:hypothetical protein